MKFRTMVEPIGKAAGVAVPGEIVESFGSGKRPKVIITINGHTWQSAIVPMGGRSIVGIGASNRTACGINAGDVVDVELTHDAEPREVQEPPDFAKALDGHRGARAAYDRMSYSQQRRLVVDIERAKTDETRKRRITKAIDAILGNKP